MKLHPHFQLINTFKHLTPQISDQLSTVLTIGFFWFNADVQLIADRFTQQGFFQTSNDIACTVQIDQRLGTSRAINHFTCVVTERVVNGDNVLIGDQHKIKTFIKMNVSESLPAVAT